MFESEQILSYLVFFLMVGGLRLVCGKLTDYDAPHIRKIIRERNPEKAERGTGP